MTGILFIRHGAHDLLGKVLTGRNYPVTLNHRGHRQAEWLAERVFAYPVAALYSSPVERCMETAATISHRLGIPVQRAEALKEVDFGAWSGLEFSKLHAEKQWRAFNAVRSLNAPPGGETFAALMARELAFFQEIQRLHPNQWIAAVSHADVIKAALAWVLGMPADLFGRLEIAPGSLSAVELGEGAAAPRVVLVNETLAE